MDPSSNVGKWTNFLSSIHSNTFEDLPTNNLTIKTESIRNIECLATTFADKLREQNDRYRERDTLTPTKKKKNDMDISCSMWDISKIAEYVNFDKCVTEIDMPTGISSCVDNIYGMVNKDLHRLSKVVRGINLEEIQLDSYSELLKQLISITTPESGSRLVLDALLIPLCSVLHLQFEVEKSINCSFLPNCRFDYCIRKGEDIIGCIEAKRVGNLSDKSIAQAVLQLMILQTTLLRTETTEVNISEVPVFAIVTDGHRFIYIQLKGSHLRFEYDVVKEKGKEPKKILKIREVKQECDFKDILQHISFLVDNSVSKKTYMLAYLFRPFNFVLQMIRNLF